MWFKFDYLRAVAKICTKVEYFNWFIINCVCALLKASLQYEWLKNVPCLYIIYIYLVLFCGIPHHS